MRDKLIEFVKQQHKGQLRKYTGEQYYNHLEAVALSAEKSGLKYGFEIGLCHDLLEDTECTFDGLKNSLWLSGYYREACNFIANAVQELTDIFTFEAYPYLNRQIRKQCEALRLHTISREAQIVKAFDLIDNTKSIIEHDPGFAKKYIPEKRAIIVGFKKLPTDIHSQVWNCLLEAEEQIKLI